MIKGLYSSIRTQHAYIVPMETPKTTKESPETNQKSSEDTFEPTAGTISKSDGTTREAIYTTLDKKRHQHPPSNTLTLYYERSSALGTDEHTEEENDHSNEPSKSKRAQTTNQTLDCAANNKGKIAAALLVGGLFTGLGTAGVFNKKSPPQPPLPNMPELKVYKHDGDLVINATLFKQATGISEGVARLSMFVGDDATDVGMPMKSSRQVRQSSGVEYDDTTDILRFTPNPSNDAHKRIIAGTADFYAWTVGKSYTSFSQEDLSFGSFCDVYNRETGHCTYAPNSDVLVAQFNGDEYPILFPHDVIHISSKEDQALVSGLSVARHLDDLPKDLIVTLGEEVFVKRDMAGINKGPGAQLFDRSMVKKTQEGYAIQHAQNKEGTAMLSGELVSYKTYEIEDGTMFLMSDKGIPSSINDYAIVSNFFTFSTWAEQSTNPILYDENGNKVEGTDHDNNHKEVDAEKGRFGAPGVPVYSYGVQPWYDAGNIEKIPDFGVTQNDDVTTTFEWTETALVISLYKGKLSIDDIKSEHISNDIIAQRTLPHDTHPNPQPGDKIKLIINSWVNGVSGIDNVKENEYKDAVVTHVEVYQPSVVSLEDTVSHPNHLRGRSEPLGTPRQELDS